MPSTELNPNNLKGNFSSEYNPVSPSPPPKFQWLQIPTSLTTRVWNTVFNGLSSPYIPGNTQGPLDVPVENTWLSTYIYCPQS